MNELLVKLHASLPSPAERSLLDGPALRLALAELPSDISLRVNLLTPSLGRLEIREQLRLAPPQLSGALSSHDPEWKNLLQPEIDTAVAYVASPECPLPDSQQLLDLSRRWNDSRLLTVALDRMESEAPGYEQMLSGLCNEFFRNRSPEDRRQLPADTSAWIGWLALSLPELSLSGAKQLEERCASGNARAKLFLVDHHLQMNPEATETGPDLIGLEALEGCWEPPN